jgi:ABC-type sugar transport system substrate-binding protein
MTMISRRTFMLAATAVGALAVAGVAIAEVPKLAQKDKYKVGFAQTESNNPWRIAQTNSMKAEAEKLGFQLVYTDAAGSAAKQVADVNSMIAQGVDVIFLAPREEKPLIPAVMAAKKAGIPVILLDRSVDPSLAKAGEDYLTFIGSDFVLEGPAHCRMAGEERQRQDEDHRTGRHDRLFAGQRPQEGF